MSQQIAATQLKESPTRGWIIWVFAAMFYSYEFFLRISPNVMVNDLMHAFHIAAANVGSISAFYYYAYAVMQLPVGVAIDRYGVRLPLFFAALIVSVGCLLFAMTHYATMAGFGRLLMGIGSAFAFVGCLKIGAVWFPRERFSIVVGLTNMLGMIGVLIGEAPLAMVVDTIGWRRSMLVTGIIGVGLAVLMLLLIRDHSSQQYDDDASGTVLDGLFTIIRNPQTWLNALYAGLMVAPIAAFAELWGVPFLQVDLGIGKPTAAALESMVFLGIACGGPMIGWLSGIFHRRVTWLYGGTLCALISLSLLIYMPIMHWSLAAFILFLFGFSSSSMLLSFSLNCEMNPPEFSGVSIAFTNMIIMAGGAAFQPLVGMLLDLQDAKIYTHGSAVFSLPAYHKALILLPLSQALAFFLLFFVQESFAKQVAKLHPQED